MSESSRSASSGLGVTWILTAIFVTLKLTNTVGWSWWIVLSPLWAPITLLLCGALVFLVVGGLIAGLVAMVRAMPDFVTWVKR